MIKKTALSDSPENHLVVFQEKAIRRTWYNKEWWFAIVDVVVVLTDSVQPEGYVKDLRRRDKELTKGWGQIATPLRIETEGGVQRVNCANTEGLFRIIQSIPSPKAEPFKRWLAQVGYLRHPRRFLSGIQNFGQPEAGFPTSTVSGMTGWGGLWD